MPAPPPPSEVIHHFSIQGLIISKQSIESLLQEAITRRVSLLDVQHKTALRLFNGFTEGYPELVIDLYGETALLYDFAVLHDAGQSVVSVALDILQKQLPWLRGAILKIRNSPSAQDRRGRILFGHQSTQEIVEHGIWYAVELTLNQDASFYLDTRNLRRWLLERMMEKTVLNAFAYTGSLGVAALAAGAKQVVQLDRNPRFLKVARKSCGLNGFATHQEHFVEEDFFPFAARLRRNNIRFDCVILDPPFFSSSPSGIVDQIHSNTSLINKVRPLIEEGGLLVAINNALYVSGAAYMQTLQTVCADGYLELVETIPVPEDLIGYSKVSVGSPFPNPSPFNHATKIAILRVHRKDSK